MYLFAMLPSPSFPIPNGVLVQTISCFNRFPWATISQQGNDLNKKLGAFFIPKDAVPFGFP